MNEASTRLSGPQAERRGRPDPRASATDPGAGKAADSAAGERGTAPVAGKVELRTWLRLLGCTNLVLGFVRRNLRAEFDTTLPSFEILAQVHHAPLGPTMTELARRLLVSKGNVTDLVQRLERRALLARTPDARDGRVQRVYLTHAGRAAVETMLAAHDRWISAATRGLDRRSLFDLYAILGALRDSVAKAGGARTRAERARAGGPQRGHAPSGRAPARRAADRGRKGTP